VTVRDQDAIDDALDELEDAVDDWRVATCAGFVVARLLIR
jgi:hypothetical protein